MRLLISLSGDSSDDKIVKYDSNGEPIGEESLDKVLKEINGEESEESEDKDKDSDQKYAAGKTKLREYEKDSGSSDKDELTDHLIDPLDGGDPNYKRKPRGGDIASAVRRTRLSHNPRDPFDT